jgi:AraC family transcriptional regulator
MDMTATRGTLVVDIHSFTMSPERTEERRIRKLKPSEVERVVSATKASLSTGARLSDIARLVGLTPSHLSRSFRASVGVTYSAFLLRLRLDTAMRLMRDTEMSLSEVATESGYCDQSHFSRSFGRAVGSTPFQWRARACG